MQRINFTETTLTTLKRNARCSFANAVYKLTMKAQQGLKCDDLFKKSVLMNEVNKLLCKYKLDECISFHPFQEGGISTWYFGIGDISPYIWEIYLNINDVVTLIGAGTDLAKIVIDINANTETTGVSAELAEDGFYMTVYSPPGCFVKADLIRSATTPESVPQTQITFVAGKCPQEETCVEYTEEELNCITPQDLQLLFEFTHKYKETLAKSTKRITSPSTSSSSPSPSDCCNWGSIGGSIGNQSDLITYLANIQKNYISIDNEGTKITNDVKSINFTGSGVNATYSGSGNVTVDIPGGGGGFECADLEGCNISLLTNDAGYLTNISADNGLTANTSTNVQLGGTLLANTTILNNGFNFVVSRAGTGNAINGVNTTSVGVRGDSTSNVGVYGNSGTNAGVFGNGSLGGVFNGSTIGMSASSVSGLSIKGRVEPSSTNSVVSNFILERYTSGGVPLNGIGQSFDFTLQTSSSADASNRLISKWTDATHISRTSQFIITTINNAVSQDSLTIEGSGQLKLNKYGTVTPFTGTPAYSLGVDASGNVIETTVSGGSQTLADTLVLGNTSGANDIQFDATQGLLFANTSRLREGTIDAGLGGTKGVAQICAVGYELKWEAGRLYVMDGNGLFIRQSLYNFTTTPTATDDTTKGYMTGSLWTLDDGTTYICSDATATAAVWAIGGIPDLQQVTNVGFTTTTKLQSDDGAGNLSALNNGVIDLATGLQTVTIDASLVTTAYNVSFPDKLTSAETFAMMSDVATPDLQQVTDIGATTTNPIIVTGFGSTQTVLNATGVDITNGAGATVFINNVPATASYNAQLPNKAAGTETFAMLSDITGGGLDLEVNGTPNVDQTLLNLIEGVNIDIADNGTGGVTITSLADRYSTSSVTSNTITNGAKTFTVDADLAYIPLQEVLIVNDPTHHMHATVTSYSGTTLVVDVTSHTGSGTFIVWVLNLDGVPVDAITGVGTANEIAYFTSGQVIASLAVATYPSLTELARVKNVGSQVVGTTDTNTLTNKRITARSGTVASSPTPTINTDNVDFYSLTAQAADITSFTTNLTGAPTEGQTLWIAITGTAARAITWGASFEASTIALPTTTATTNRLDVAFIYNTVTSKWRCVGVA